MKKTLLPIMSLMLAMLFVLALALPDDAQARRPGRSFKKTVEGKQGGSADIEHTTNSKGGTTNYTIKGSEGGTATGTTTTGLDGGGAKRTMSITGSRGGTASGSSTRDSSGNVQGSGTASKGGKSADATWNNDSVTVTRDGKSKTYKRGKR